MFDRMANVPDGTVFVAVDESTADGTFVANRRTSAAFDTPLEGGRFTFRSGRLVRSAFRRGGAAFRSEYRAARAGKERPSFVEIGVDPAVSGTPMLEESERGAVTVGVGRNRGFGGKTDTNFLGYLTLSGARLEIDGRAVVRGGRLVAR